MPELTFRTFLRTCNEMYNESSRLYHEMAKLFGLSDCAFWILYSIRDEARPLTQTDLCGLLFLPKQTIHSALKNLEAAGYIILASTEENRKAKQIHLTESGEDFLSRTIDHVFQLERSAFLKLSPQDREAYLELEQKHLAALKEATLDMMDSCKPLSPE